jgi:hypothetical protein
MSIDPSFIMLNIRLSLFAYFAVINIRFSHALGGDQRPFLKEIDDILYKLDPSRKANFCIEYIRSMLDRAKIPGQIHPDYLPHVINILKKEDLSLPEQTKKICLKMLFSTFISELHNKNEYAAFLGLLSALYLPNGHNDFNRGVAQYLLELLNSSRDQHDEQYQPLIPPGSLEPFRSLLEQGLTR